MIKIIRTPRPKELTNEVSKTLTKKFIEEQVSVWKAKYITEALREMSHGKCCYCEAKINISGNYMHVEHFHDKSEYPEKVVEWDNLLPSCAHCNCHKGNTNVVITPLINPTVDIPKDYVYMVGYRYIARNKNQKAINTIAILNLNDVTGLALQRFHIANDLLERVEDIYSNLDNIPSFSPSTRANIKNKLERILKATLPNSEFSASNATAILTGGHFPQVKAGFIRENLWDENLSNLETNMICAALIE